MFELGYRGAAELNQGRPGAQRRRRRKGAMVNCPEANQLASLLPSVCSNVRSQFCYTVPALRCAMCAGVLHCTGVGKRFIIMIMAYIL